MKIGELAAKTGLTRDTIRFYEQRGLLVDISRPYEYNNYKDYGEANVYRLQMIQEGKQFGFTLNYTPFDDHHISFDYDNSSQVYDNTPSYNIESGEITMFGIVNS